MGLFDTLFAPKQQPVQQPTQQQPVNGVQSNPANPSMQPTPVNPDNSGQETKDPMEAFKDLWTPPKPEDAAKNPANFDPTSMFQVDPQKVAQAVGQMDFTKSIKPEQLKAITEGGEGAANALLQILNASNQQTFMQAMLASAELTKQAMGKANDSLDARMAEQVRRQGISNSLREANPFLARPEVAPLVTAMEAQFAQKYPTASPSEITKMATEYLSKVGEGFAPKKEEAVDPNKPKETDWAELFLGPQN